MAKMIPTIGIIGMSGQRIMRIPQRIPPIIIIMVPIIKRRIREKKPTIRETSRSINICILSCIEELAEAAPAEI